MNFVGRCYTYYGTQDRSVIVQCAPVIHFLYWSYDLLTQSNQILTDIYHSAANCLGVQAKWTQRSTADLCDATSFEPAAWDMGSTPCVFHSTHHHLLVYLCSARHPPSVLLCTEPPDRPMLIQAWQQINKLYSLSISVGGYKKCLLSSVLEHERDRHVKGCLRGLTSPDFGINKQQSGHRA